MSGPTPEQKARMVARKAKLDAAFEEYVQDMMSTGDAPSGGVLVGWIAGLQIMHFGEDGVDSDGILTEEKPNMNTFLARGVADATAERFQQNATGWYDEG